MSRGEITLFVSRLHCFWEPSTQKRAAAFNLSNTTVMFSSATQPECPLEDTLLDLHVRMFPIRLADRKSSILKVGPFRYEYRKRSGHKENHFCFLSSREHALCGYSLLPPVFNFFRRRIRTQYQGLSRELSDVQHQFGTAEISRLRD